MNVIVKNVISDKNNTKNRNNINNFKTNYLVVAAVP